jgi:hypothetical protein
MQNTWTRVGIDLFQNETGWQLERYVSFVGARIEVSLPPLNQYWNLETSFDSYRLISPYVSNMNKDQGQVLKEKDLIVADLKSEFDRVVRPRNK